MLERRSQLAPEGVGLVLQPNGLSVLDRLGVLDEVLAVGQRITTVNQCDASGRVRARGSYAGLSHPHPYLVVVARADAISVLARRLPAAAELWCGCGVNGLERASGRVCGVRYIAASGDVHVLEAGCVVGADGIGSAVRHALGARLRWRTGPDRYLIGFSRSAPTHDAGVLYCGEDWCNGVMPFRGGSYFFDHINAENREAVERGDFAAWREVYARRVPEGARITAELASFDEVGFLSGRTHRARPRTRPGAALVGDAAAAVHPHNGQGANLALEDAWELATALVEHGPDSDEALRRYVRARDGRVGRQVAWSIFIGRTFDGPTPAWRAIRSAGYLAARLPLVQRATTRRQAGLA